MHGNVWEWVSDCWHKDYQHAPTDGSAWTTACYQNNQGQIYRVFRGGSWRYEPISLHSASRSGGDANSRYSGLGFRLLRLAHDGVKIVEKSGKILLPNRLAQTFH